ncbi:coiled-coil domain-containing protein 122 isoform X1 [Pogona vitticeps]
MATNQSASSLIEVVKQVADQQNIQASEIEKSKSVLVKLQTHVLDLETQLKHVVSERKATERQLYYQDEAIANAKKHCEDLETQIRALYAENMKLTLDTEALEEEFQVILLRNNAYYEKITAHKRGLGQMESKLPLMLELAEKKATVKEMITQKEEQMTALQHLDIQSTGSVQDEILCLEDEINVLKEAISKKENELQYERNMHVRLQKETEVQNKRYEAILKRLHCQVNRLQSSKRQHQWNILQMEEKAVELRKLLGATNE